MQHITDTGLDSQKLCPSCQSADIIRWVIGSHRSDEQAWKCSACKHRFDVPSGSAPALDLQSERERRTGHRDLGAIHIYEFLSGPDDPPWHELIHFHQGQFRTAFLIAAQSIDMQRLREWYQPVDDPQHQAQHQQTGSGQ